MKPKLAAVVASLALAGLAACGSSDAAASQRIRIGIDHSTFLPEGEMTFAAGDTVTFVISNDDPIDHEFILGDRKVQDRHEEGRQRHHHGEVPGEVSVPAGETRATTYTFSEPGKLIYACHLPGHYNYGMRGEVTVK
jgi:uncharacterized cupredoxin-like copper-binding protein